jgi:hypothetical protein
MPSRNPPVRRPGKYPIILLLLTSLHLLHTSLLKIDHGTHGYEIFVELEGLYPVTAQVECYLMGLRMV